MPKLTVASTTLEKPRWPGNILKPAETTTLQVDAPQIKPDQFIEFRILQGEALIETVKGDAGKTSVTWKVPNLPHNPSLHFDAVLKQKASPKTGFHAVLAKATSSGADLRGFKVEITGGDASFVPHTEQVQITYKVTDPSGVAVKGRYEIWGERYPDDAPLYTENFTPAAGPATWSTWDGKANSGKSNGKYISPEFSPYRVRIIIGVDQASVNDAFGAGISQVAAAEGTFEVVFQSVQIRLQAGIAEAAATPNYTLAQALAIEPPAPNGTYAAMGRLPTSTPAETCRIRVPMACHQRALTIDTINQGGLNVSGAYLAAPGQSKQLIDAAFYNRPEIPIEFELHLRSRDPAKNAAPTSGVFDKEATGPAKLEPFAENVFLPALYNGATPDQTYWRKSAFKIKKGAHNLPVNSGAAGVPPNAPVFDYWQARFVVAAAGDHDFDLDTFDAADPTYHFAKGSNELTVYLNRTKLVLGANQAALDKVQADYIEVDNHTIKLRANLTRANDVLWIVRSAAGVATVPDWNAGLPGTNCHRWNGGVRGVNPAGNLLFKLFAKNFSPPVGTEPVIGKTTAAFPYGANNFINLGPDTGLAANLQERVEVSAITAAGAQQGLAGVLFSPSFIAGDSYAINAFVDAAPYERNLGWVQAAPAVQGKTGTLSVWRVITMTNSVRLPTIGTPGLAAGVGSAPDAPIAGPGARAYIGDGRNMSFTAMNAMLTNAFNEWTVQLPPGPAAPVGDVHKDANLGAYRGAYNGLALGAGQIPMPGNANVLNQFLPFDHYRVRLPRGIPANRVNAATNAITALPRGSTSSAAMAAVAAALAALAPGAADPPLIGGVAAAIPVAPLAPAAYLNWVKGQVGSSWGALVTALTPKIVPQPKVMQVIRWPLLHDSPIWDGAAPMHSTGGQVAGFSSGDAQSFFLTRLPLPTLFAHEMGHSAHLAHFIGENFCFKHHNLLQIGCMMSYTYPTGFIVPDPALAAPVGPAGVAAAVDTGWPSTVPLALPQKSSIVPGTATGTRCIQLGPTPVGNPCAKCMLKLRGWQEMNMPCAWNHPDLF